MGRLGLHTCARAGRGEHRPPATGLWHNAYMARRRVTVSLGDDVLRALDDAARRSGESRSRLVERTLARELAGSKLKELRSTAKGAALSDEEGDGARR